MANYEFECGSCGKAYDYLDLTSNPRAKRPCPKCGTKNVKIMSAPKVILKRGGVGWAKDGYSNTRSMADGPEPRTGDRHKRSGKTVIPVSNPKGVLKGGKSDKKPMLKVQK